MTGTPEHLVSRTDESVPTREGCCLTSMKGLLSRRTKL
jgi:hypothetical protein